MYKLSTKFVSKEKCYGKRLYKMEKLFYNEKGRKDNYVCPKIIDKDCNYYSSVVFYEYFY